MAELNRTFVLGRMNKSYDQRVVPNGEYIDALNVRMGSTEKSEVGVIENAKGTDRLTSLSYIDGTPLSSDALSIGSYADGASETVYWFVHDPSFSVGATGKLDMIVSMNVLTGILTYHVVSIDDGSGVNTALNFNPKYLISQVNKIENLLFFVNGKQNPPRFLNVKRTYPIPVVNVDQFSAESLLVIKKPPVSAPAVEPTNTGGQSNYMEDKFISFAYRYRYADGEYSAISQWSEVAFTPKDFVFIDGSFLNGGMQNSSNAAVVTYNSGGPLVVGVDLLFKVSDSNVINVIERITKSTAGQSDDTDYSYTFSNSKIFTILSDAELLRLYDNVPLYADAQTLMGNRLMYGAYIDGRNLIDNYGFPVLLEFSTDLITEQINDREVPVNIYASNYTIDGFHSVADSVMSLNFTGVPLKEGASIAFSLSLSHDSFTGTVPGPDVNEVIPINFQLILKNTYASVYDFATSSEFQEAIGTISNIQSVANSCNGTKMTDVVNCNTATTLNTYTKYGSGISAIAQPINIITIPTSPYIDLQFLAMEYVDDVGTPTASFYEYYKIIYAAASFKDVAVPKSLHSNRGYEIGIVYMDEFNRATTALVSPYNTEHVPCGNSDVQNKIYVTIPYTQRPPSWATRYKFVCKPDAEGYETIFANTYFVDPASNNCYLLLEGENARKVEAGDTLIVKADSNGPKSTCAYATVLEKESKSSGFIVPSSGAVVPAGVYAKINTNEISINTNEQSVITFGRYTDGEPLGICPIRSYPANIEDPNSPGDYIDYSIPLGSKIILSFGATNPAGPTYDYKKTFTSSTNYSSFEDWWNGDNIGATLNSGSLSGDVIPGFVFDFIYLPGNNPAASIIALCNQSGNCYFGFERDGATNRLVLHYQSSGYLVGYSSLYIDIQVFRSGGTLIFETKAAPALPDVFYENELSFPIVNGNHIGNVQNQDIDTQQPAIINTGFFNCFAFGNGAESYKSQDSIVGHSFGLGQRVTSVSEQDYKEANRFADMTYSGVFNSESNLNRLNEFNLGLSNYKKLESSFGPIRVLDGRETDVLVLQEDKISYVLAGKNLLSDSAAGGAIASVPEVLGTQIARVEKYGISFNPESYVHWGVNRYFTDIKRGAVLQLVGGSAQNEELLVISEQGMRTWFRDNFIESFTTQKLGGYDPYMDEYVLSTNDRALPDNQACLECGLTQTLTIPGPIDAETVTQYCVLLGDIVGEAEVSYNVVSLSPDGGELVISSLYNGVEVSSGVINTEGPGSFAINKNVNFVDTAQITITSIGPVIIDINVKCPQPVELTVVSVVVTNNDEAGQSIHA